MDAGDYHGRLARHVADIFPETVFRELTWRHGLIGQHLPNWRVMAGQLLSQKGAWAYFTHGAWEVTQNNHAFEFFMLSGEPRDDINAELLAMITFFYGDPRSGLDVGKVLNIGKPWSDNSDLDHILIYLPYPRKRIISGGQIDGASWELHDWETSEPLARGDDGIDELDAVAERLDPGDTWMHIDAVTDLVEYEPEILTPDLPASLCDDLAEWARSASEDDLVEFLGLRSEQIRSLQ